MSYKLICFDVDDTLVESWTDKLLPNVRQWFDDHKENRPAIAFVTNQGGVGLKHWMAQENWGEPDRFPSEPEVYVRLMRIARQLGLEKNFTVHVCFAYQSSSGKWGPTPYDSEEGDQVPLEWRRDRRKPAAGMLIDAMGAHEIYSNVLFVGDRIEDELAALAAQVNFRFADEFFIKNAFTSGYFSTEDEPPEYHKRVLFWHPANNGNWCVGTLHQGKDNYGDFFMPLSLGAWYLRDGHTMWLNLPAPLVMSNKGQKK